MHEEDLQQFDRTELLNNKTLAFSRMLPKETQRVNSIRRGYGLQLISVVDEYTRLQIIYNKRFNGHFHHLSQNNTTLLSDAFNLVKLLTSI
jgi:hypothetical protein